ncbi:hypothetical protein HYY75_04905 [bacterium]|nr:hypothetical protein [bacterium]
MEADILKPNEQKVVEMARGLEDILQQSLGWAQTHLKQPQVQSFILKTLQQKKGTAKKILDSAYRPIALGVFGSSQCGKSYLVSELIKGDQKALEIYISGKNGTPVLKDYLETINPAGGRESTALITRFTKRPYAEVRGCSIHARLISRTDIIKILLNGFLFECVSDFTPSADDLLKLKNSFRGIPRDPVPVFSADDIWDIQDYAKRHFRNQFLKMLEDINYKLTELYRSLHKALGDLGDQVVGLYDESLVPREKSIIDIERLYSLGKPGNRKCAVVPASGGAVEFDTSFLCALTRELILKVPQEVTNSLLDQMDVLDFPGARSREQVFDQSKLASDPLALSEVFKRGKVAYLFDRSSDDRDITGLVLCQEGGPQEAKSLPYMINKWIEWSHGPNPKSRQGKPLLLFHVFTKFDLDLIWKKGEDQNVRWESRLKSNFEEFFGRAGDWVVNWDETGAFRNCFWVRNPNVQQTVFGRKDGLEFIREETQLAETKAQYCRHELVRKHFRNPEEAWDEAASPNHAGIPYLKDRIRKTIEPNSKVIQLGSNIQAILHDVKTHLKPYHVGDDVSQARLAAEERAKKRLSALMKAMPTRYSLAFMLDHERFAISEKTVAMIYDSIVNPMIDEKSDDEKDSSSLSIESPRFDESIFEIPGVETQKEPEKVAKPPMKKGDLFAKAVIDRWHEQLIQMTADLEFQREIELDSEWLTDITQELMKGASRFSLYEKISEDSDKRLNSPASTKLMRMQSASTAALLNRFVTELGQARKEIQIPKGPPKANLSAKSYPGLAIYQHWTMSLIKLFKDNIAEGDKIDEESNSKLKRILDFSIQS